MTKDQEHLQRELPKIAQYEATGGQEASDLMGVPLIVLTTRGRTSGKPRQVMLVRCVHDGVYAVVGSGPDPIEGSTRHSQWYLNLVNDPRVTVRDRDE